MNLQNKTHRCYTSLCFTFFLVCLVLFWHPSLPAFANNCSNYSGWSRYEYVPQQSCGACTGNQQVWALQETPLKCDGTADYSHGNTTQPNCSASNCSLVPPRNSYIAFATNCPGNDPDPYKTCQGCPFPWNYEICGDGMDNNGNGIPDEGCGGDGGACMNRGAPVNLQTGNMTLTHTDFSINTGAIPIVFQRTYNSNFANSIEYIHSRLGLGWRHNYQSRLLQTSQLTGLSGNQPLPPQTLPTKLVNITMGGGKSLSFEESNSGPPVYVARERNKGYKLEVLSNPVNNIDTLLTTPSGMKLYYIKSYGLLVKMEAPNGQYLFFSYASHQPTGMPSSFYLTAISPYFKNHRPTEKAVYFSYTKLPIEQGAEQWFIRTISIGPHKNPSPEGSQQAAPNPVSCTGYASQFNHSSCTQLSSLERTHCSIDLDNLPTGSGNYFLQTGICSKPIVYYSYKIMPQGSPNVVLLEKNFLKFTANGPLTGSSDHAIEYTYHLSGAGTYRINEAKALSLMSNSTVSYTLEKHDYHSSITGTDGTTETSYSAEGNMRFVYNWNQAHTVSLTNKTTIAVGGDPVLSPKLLQTVEYYPQFGKFKSQTGDCLCSTQTADQKWEEQYGFILLKATKQVGASTYTTYKYIFDSTQSRITQMIITYGDNDDDPLTPSTYPNSYQVTIHYHPLYTGLIAMIERPSVNGSSFKSRIIYDYDDPSNTSGYCTTPDTCSETDFNKNPTALLYRIIAKGYTRTPTGGTSWQLVTSTTSYSYDGYGRITEIQGTRHIDASQPQKTTFEYYDFNPNNTNAIHIHNAYMLGYMRRYAYGPRSGSSPSYHVLITQYDEHNARGHVTKYRDNTSAGAAWTSLIYDVAGFLESVEVDNSYLSSSSLKWSYTRDSIGRIRIITSPSGSQLRYGLDNYGRLSSIAFKESNASPEYILRSYQYDDAGRITSIISPYPRSYSNQDLVATLNYQFTSSGEKEVTYNPPAIYPIGSSKTLYHLNGNIKQFTDPNGYITDYTYGDSAYPDRQTAITRYVVAGMLNIPVTVSFVYDALGRVISVQDPNNVTTSYTWDDFDRLVEIQSPDQAPSGKTLQFWYDKDGNLIQKKRPNGSIVQYTYDTLNRLIYVDYPSTSGGFLTDNDVELFYDESNISFYTNGHLTTVKVKMYKADDGSGVLQDVVRTTHYKYDAAGHLREESYTDTNSLMTFTTQYDYNLSASQLTTSIRYPLLARFNKFFNPLGQLLRLEQEFDSQNKATRLVRQYTTDGNTLSRLIHDFSWTSNVTAPSAAYGNVETTLWQTSPYATPYVQDSLSQNFPKDILSYQTSGPASLSTTEGHAGIIHRFYRSNKSGKLVARHCETALGSHCYLGNYEEKYSYDSLGRLLTAGVPDAQTGTPRFSFEYDGNGNITRQTDSQQNLVWNQTYTTGTNRLYQRQLSGSSNIITYNHDHDGTRLYDNYWMYTYHSDGRLAWMLPTPYNSATYDIFFAYDHRGRRVRKELYDRNSSDLISYTNYLYDISGNLIEQFGEQLDSSSNTWKFAYKQWVWHDGKAVLGERVHSDSSGAFGSQSINFHTDDHIGKIVAATSVTGLPLWRSQSEPYGMDLGLSLDSANVYQEFLMSQTSLGNVELSPYANNSTWQTTRNIITPGTFGIQFYFEKLSLETGRDHLVVSSKELPGVGDQVLHLFTGEHFTGKFNNPANPFWGPVLPFRPKSITATANAKSDILFEVLSNTNTAWSGFKITKYRTWNVASGDTLSHLKNDTTANPATRVYEAYLGDTGYSPLKPPWERVYTDDISAPLRRVCFSGFDVEDHYDYVEIRDGSDNIIQVMTGNLGDVCSVWVYSNSIKVQLYSDYSVEKAGFVVQRVETMRGAAVHARFPGQWYESETEVKDSNGNLLYAGLHYNWHRYYDPNAGRYITPDPLGLEAGMNLYSYAGNDPVNLIDPFGLEEIQIHQWTLAGAIPERRNPHVGLLIKNKILESILFSIPSKDKNIIFLDKSPVDGTKIGSWFPPYFRSTYRAEIGAQPYAYKASVWKFKTTFAQDLCVLEEGLASHQKCLQATAKNAYQGCRWILAGGNCEDWAIGTLEKCGVRINIFNYQPLGYHGNPLVTVTTKRTTYDWGQHLDGDDMEFEGLRFLNFKETRRILDGYYKNSIPFVNSFLPELFKLSSP